MRYADEADVLNIAMFGMTAKQWREANPDKKGNIRDYASINELISIAIEMPYEFEEEDVVSKVCEEEHLQK